MKRILHIILIVAAVLIVAVLALPFLIDANGFKPTLESRLTAALAREIHLGDLKLSVLSGSVAANDLSIADDPAFSKTHFLRASSLNVGVDLLTLILQRQLVVTGLLIDQPEVNLVQSSKGEWNFSTMGGKAHPESVPRLVPTPPADDRPLDLSVKLVSITNGRFNLGSTRGKAKPQQLEKINIQVNDFSADSPFTFSLSASVVGGGDLKLQGKAGPIPPDVSATPFDATLTIKGLDVARSGLVPPSTGISGLVSVDGHATSNGNLVTVKGKLKADSLKLVDAGHPDKEPVELDLAVAHDMRKQGGTLQRSAIRIGKAVAYFSGSYNLAGEIPVIRMRLDGSKMALTELTSILPALDVVLPGGSSIEGGTVTVDFSSDGPLDKLVTIGTIDVEKTRLAHFDLGSKMKLVEKFAGVPDGVNTDIDVLSASLDTGPAGTDVKDIKLVVPAIGALAGAGTISPQHALNFHMQAALRTGSATMTAIGQNGETGVPFMIEGTSENPAFKADVRGMAGALVKNPGKAVDAAKGLIRLFK
jgi:AsmA protein